MVKLVLTIIQYSFSGCQATYFSRLFSTVGSIAYLSWDSKVPSLYFNFVLIISLNLGSTITLKLKATSFSTLSLTKKCELRTLLGHQQTCRLQQEPFLSKNSFCERDNNQASSTMKLRKLVRWLRRLNPA